MEPAKCRKMRSQRQPTTREYLKMFQRYHAVSPWSSERYSNLIHPSVSVTHNNYLNTARPPPLFLFCPQSSNLVTEKHKQFAHLHVYCSDQLCERCKDLSLRMAVKCQHHANTTRDYSKPVTETRDKGLILSHVWWKKQYMAFAFSEHEEIKFPSQSCSILDDTSVTGPMQLLQSCTVSKSVSIHIHTGVGFKCCRYWKSSQKSSV